MRRTRRPFVALAAVTAWVVLLAGPASAASVVAADRKGDGVGPGDVRALNLEHHNDVLRIRVRTERPIDLDSSPAWHRHGSLTLLRIFLDSDPSSPGADYVVVVKPAAGELAADLVTLLHHAPRDGCIPSLAQPQPTMIQAAFGIGCVLSGPSIRAYTSYRFDQGGDGSIQSTDRAPNTGFGPRLAIVL